jgi:glucose/arabinose dehydrogenase
MMNRLGIRAVAMLTCLAVVCAVPGRSAAQTGLSVPPGFHATVYAENVSGVTAMSIGPDRRLYAAVQSGAVVSIGSGSRRTVATVSGVPLGLAWHAGRLYVSYTGSIAALTPNRAFTSFTLHVLVTGLPTGVHQNDGLAFNGAWMYVGVGSTCNACVESDPRSATIMRFHLDGSHGQVFARGLRNPYGLAIQPGTGRLYATDNGRDDYDDQVPDELNLIVRNGRYGWPNCWGKRQGLVAGCAQTRPAVIDFEPHASADGLIFYRGTAFPPAYRHDAFVAEYGQTVGVGTNGHRVKWVHLSGSGGTYGDFVTGLSHPVALTEARNGSVLVGDFGTGIIWRISANGH